MFKNTEAVICFIVFSHQFSDRLYGSFMIQSSDNGSYMIRSFLWQLHDILSDFDKIKFEPKAPILIKLNSKIN